MAVSTGSDLGNSERTLTSLEVKFYDESVTRLLKDTSFVECTLVESLLTPFLQTSLKFHSFNHIEEGPKILELFKNKIVDIKVKRPILADAGIRDEMNITQRLYRLDSRKPLDFNNEEFQLRLCDQTLLTDAKNLVSHSWKCSTPTQVTQEVLTRCADARLGIMEASQPPRDYIADNIHPFQVVSQQADVALASGDDPSFVHFMTYEGMSEGSGDPRGLHHFRSLKRMAQGAPKYQYIHADSGYDGKYSSIQQLSNGLRQFAIMNHSFPADFDVLSDILNGVGGGKSLLIYRPADKIVSLLGFKGGPCGVGGQNFSQVFSDLQNPSLEGCPTNVEKYMLLRQARMNLLSEGDIALRMTVPWTTGIHAGDIIRVLIPHKPSGASNYGSGDYLISSIVHNIRAGGYSTITMDCVSETVGRGEL
jgi:hypothetical protein